MKEIHTHMNVLPLQNLRALKHSDHLAHKTRITYRNKRYCQGLVPRVPRAAGYGPNESTYGPVPSGGKRLGN
jgi:hypothetical protein